MASVRLRLHEFDSLQADSTELTSFISSACTWQTPQRVLVSVISAAHLSTAKHDPQHIGLDNVDEVRISGVCQRPIAVSVAARVVDPTVAMLTASHPCSSHGSSQGLATDRMRTRDRPCRAVCWQSSPGLPHHLALTHWLQCPPQKRRFVAVQSPSQWTALAPQSGTRQ